MVKSLVRFVLVILAVFFSLPRIDRSPFPAWVEYYLLLDSGSKSYQALIVMYNIHNNPVMRVAAWIIEEEAANRRDPAKRQAHGLVPPKRRRIVNRWQKAYFLVKNPSLVKCAAAAPHPLASLSPACPTSPPARVAAGSSPTSRSTRRS